LLSLPTFALYEQHNPDKKGGANTVVEGVSEKDLVIPYEERRGKKKKNTTEPHYSTVVEYPRRKYKRKKDPSYKPENWEGLGLLKIASQVPLILN